MKVLGVVIPDAFQAAPAPPAAERQLTPGQIARKAELEAELNEIKSKIGKTKESKGEIEEQKKLEEKHDAIKAALKDLSSAFKAVVVRLKNLKHV
ncbi:hypothetical protein P170DRAFT_512673 [Aspergillus steynii IBT 23096]|uniref:Uncharacterized protein n=1 Tax=Aspergillus steynii IBT 23096 TaxID=1392250 RepID=A0A2I2FZN0_9EURO|nr:uncharacterized protein P170DRAFT_512673 [Aspergillus steynii IBT 23096]PLB46089.1 hypothetical protein P170DRAFT_512673 [Aspergillus steynii IBT 23096]